MKNVPDAASLADLGMDSLMGAEIKQTLERNFDVIMNPQEIRQLAFGELKKLEGGGNSEPEAISARDISSPSCLYNRTYADRVYSASEI